jgi:uncharacterized membrane protein
MNTRDGSPSQAVTNMWRLWNTFLKGLAAVLPVALTLYVVYWLGTTAEDFLGDGLRLILPSDVYRPGMGLIVGFLVVLGVGTLVNAYIVRLAIRWGETWLARIPLVKTIFGALKDLARFLPAGGERRDLQRVVLWRFGAARLIGFVTAERVHEKLCGECADNMVAVYFPMSYTIGGYTLYLPRSELQASDLTVEEGLRLVLIGGITSEKPHAGR